MRPSFDIQRSHLWRLVWRYRGASDQWYQRDVAIISKTDH